MNTDTTRSPSSPAHRAASARRSPNAWPRTASPSSSTMPGSAAEAEALAGKIEEAGGRAITAQADVSDPAAVARMFDAAEAAFGGVDVLVNNAGIMKLASDRRERRRSLRPPDRDQPQGHVQHAARGGQAAARRRPHHQPLVQRRALSADLWRLCRDQGGGRSDDPFLSKELRGRNITVNAVAPGTDRHDLFLDGKPQAGDRH